MLAGAAVVLILATDIDFHWKAITLVLAVAALPIVNRETRRRHPAARAIVCDDGNFRLDHPAGPRHGVLTGQAWVSRWLCVFHWRDARGRLRQCLVMASTNRPDDYRRLRVVLRLAPVATAS